jgi:GNAT superfamily N-acetyltransferase
MDVKQKFRVIQSRLDMAEALAAIQQACFPTLAEAERISAAQYQRHMEVFPEGQLTVVGAAGRPAASSTDLICRMDFDHYQHRFMEATGDNWLTTHDPDGDWLYGADIGVHPDYRGTGLSRLLYDARKDLIRRLNLKGHVCGGMLSGYGSHRDMDVRDYVDQVVAGRIFDPTLSVQLRRGFWVAGIIDDYLDDPVCDNKAALIVWRNPDYRA